MRSCAQYTSSVSEKEVLSLANTWAGTVLNISSSRSCTASTFTSIIIFAACYASSIRNAITSLQHDFTQQTFWNLLRKNQSSSEQLHLQLNDLLLLPEMLGLLRKRKWEMALDYHMVHYYGDAHMNSNELRHYLPSKGTTKYHCYASLCIIDNNFRYTVAIAWVRGKEDSIPVLNRLLKQLKNNAIRVKKLLLDRYFFNVKVLQWLKANQLPFVMPVVLRGRKPKRRSKSTGMRSFLKKGAGRYPAELKSGKENVSFTIVVTYKTRKHCTKKILLACWEIKGKPTEIASLYRRRFGIEASYRQLNQTRARTSSKDPKFRFLLIAVGMLLRNLWVWLNYQARKGTKSKQSHRIVLIFKNVLKSFQEIIANNELIVSPLELITYEDNPN